MSQFNVFPERLFQSVGEITAVSGVLSNAMHGIERVQGAIHISSAVDATIRQKLANIKEELERERRTADLLGSSLDQIAAVYENAENKILSVEIHSEVKDSVSGAVSGPISTEFPVYATDSSYSFADDKPWYNTSGALISGSVAGDGKFLGFNTKGSLSGELLGFSTKTKFKSGITRKQQDDGSYKLNDVTLFDASVSGEGHVAKGKAEGSIGYLKGSVEGTALTVSGTGGVTCSLFKSGKLSPQLGARAEAKATGLEGTAKASFGDSDVADVHGEAKGTVGLAKAKAEGAIGKVSYKNSSGQEITGYGIKGGAKAEAYAAEGKVSGGVSILGIKIDAGIGGKAGGAGIGAEGGISTGGVGGKVSAGVFLGLELELNIDWSGFSLFK